MKSLDSSTLLVVNSTVDVVAVVAVDVVDVVDESVVLVVDGLVLSSLPSLGGFVTVMTLFSGLRVLNASFSASRLLKSICLSVVEY